MYIINESCKHVEHWGFQEMREDDNCEMRNTLYSPMVSILLKNMENLKFSKIFFYLEISGNSQRFFFYLEMSGNFHGILLELGEFIKK